MTNPFEVLSAKLDALADDVKLLQRSAQHDQPLRRRYDMTVPMVAKRLKLADQTVRKNCHLGLMPYSKRNGRLYFDEQEIEAWLQAARCKTAAEIAEERMAGTRA